MKTTISINDSALSDISVKEYHIISDIYSLTPRIVLSVSDEGLLPYLLPGCEIRIDFSDDNGQPLLDTSFYLTDAIAKPAEGTQNPGSLSDITVKGRLLTELGETKARGYFGTVSAVVKQAIVDEVFASSIIDDSSDTPRLRYQLDEPASSFLERIKKYAVDGINPMYLYTDIFGNLYLKSRKNFMGASIKYQMESISNPSNSSSYPKLIIFGLSQTSGNSDLADKRTKKFTVLTFHETDRPNMKTEAYLESGSPYEMNERVTHYSWDTDPYGEVSMLINDHYQREDKLQEVVAITPVFHEVKLGDLVYVNDLQVTCMVTYIDYLRDDGQELTKLVMTYVRD